MSSAKITLIGLNNHYDLFQDLILPEGIDKDTLVDNILLRGGEFELLYSDPEFIAGAVKIWSRKWQHTFTRWIKALNTKYNPLENYDRFEEWTEDSTGHNNNKTDGSTFNEVSAYNSSNLEPDGKTTLSNQNEMDVQNNSKHVGHLHGNIGVTSSQDMLKQELDIAYWNIYEHITDIFLSEFVLPIF